MNSIITRALMRYHNDFFKMTEEEQDIFKLEDHDELDEKVSDFIDKELGFVDGVDDHNHKKLLERNKVGLHYNGIGPDYFMLNEFGWRKEVLKYKNFYEYNEANHIFQEESWKEDFDVPDYKQKELFNRLGEWARVEINGEFNYLNIFSYQIWVYYALEELEMDWIDKHIPYDFVPGPNNGKKTDGGTLWDMRQDANGKEGWLEQMKDFSREWTQSWYDKACYDHKWDMVFINDTSGKDFDGDPNKEYIFGSLDILKQVSFRTFVPDCEKIQGDSELAYKFRDELIEEFRAALDAKFVEVQKTPPNVVKLKKKMKVSFADGALDDLMRLDAEDDEDGD